MFSEKRRLKNFLFAMTLIIIKLIISIFRDFILKNSKGWRMIVIFCNNLININHTSLFTHIQILLCTKFVCINIFLLYFFIC